MNTKTFVIAIAAFALSGPAFSNEEAKIQKQEAGTQEQNMPADPHVTYGEQEQDSASQQAGAQASQDVVSQIQKTTLLNEIQHMNQKEIEWANLAQEKAQSQQLKDLAKQIAQDHQRANQKLQQIARQQNIQLSEFSMAGWEKASTDRLNQLSGSDFDRAFVELNRSTHNQTMEQLQAALKDVKDKQIESYVKQDLMPAMKQHQKMAKTVTPSQTASG